MAKIVQLIYVDSERVGNGKDTPVRILQQLFTLDGRLIAQYDPIDESDLTKSKTFAGDFSDLSRGRLA